MIIALGTALTRLYQRLRRTGGAASSAATSAAAGDVLVVRRSDKRTSTGAYSTGGRSFPSCMSMRHATCTEGVHESGSFTPRAHSINSPRTESTLMPALQLNLQVRDVAAVSAPPVEIARWLPNESPGDGDRPQPEDDRNGDGDGGQLGPSASRQSLFAAAGLEGIGGDNRGACICTYTKSLAPCPMSGAMLQRQVGAMAEDGLQCCGFSRLNRRLSTAALRVSVSIGAR